jgi:signal transduction histidine kinase
VFALGAGFRRERILRRQVASAAKVRTQAAAVQERLRVARELHDILSHSLSVVVVQAEVADTFLDTDQARSREAIRSVAATGRAALDETRRLVNLLRDPDADLPESPLPGLDDIPALVDRIRRSGLPVSLDVGSDLPSLTTDGTVTAYRVVQESLTNVLRHAGQTPTRVGLQSAPGALEIDIRNEGNGLGPTPRQGGHGLLGMRERVQSCGGEMISGPCEGGGFQVRAVLPAQDGP